MEIFGFGHMIKKGIERGIIPKEFSYVGDMDSFDFDDGFFDIVMSRYAFHDTEDQERLLNQIRRILKKGGKAAGRRKSFCKRMKGMKAKLTSAKTARDPDSRINKSLRKWNCN